MRSLLPHGSDKLDTNRVNVTKNIEKWAIDVDGKRSHFSGRNFERRGQASPEKEVAYDDHEEVNAVLFRSYLCCEFSLYV